MVLSRVKRRMRSPQITKPSENMAQAEDAVVVAKPGPGFDHASRDKSATAGDITGESIPPSVSGL